MSRKLAYIGYGSLGKQLSVLIQQSGVESSEQVFFDDIASREKLVSAFPFEQYIDEKYAGYEFLVCLGYRQLETKSKIISQLQQMNRRITGFVHASAIINPSASISESAIIYAGCVVDQQVRLEQGCFLNNSVSISHDSVIGANSFLAPGVVVCGNVRVGKQCFIGAGSVISNGVSIGDNAIIGVGTVVSSDLPAGSSAIGNPMRILDSKIELR